MTDEERQDVENLIEKVEKDFKDYLDVSQRIGLPQSVIDDRTNFFLDDLSRLYKKINK